jgi:small subunit ribosomal protein S3
MGQKVNPIGIRLGITRDWTSRWYAGKKQFAGCLNTPTSAVREFLRKKLAEAVSAHPDRARRQQRPQHHDPHRASRVS